METLAPGGLGAVPITGSVYLLFFFVAHAFPSSPWFHLVDVSLGNIERAEKTLPLSFFFPFTCVFLPFNRDRHFTEVTAFLLLEDRF